MIALFAFAIVPLHRVLFVFTTALLGVSGSFLAANPDCIANWLGLIGTGLGMYVGDVCGDIENNARRLASRGNTDIKATREELVRDGAPEVIIFTFLSSGILTVVGFLFGG